MTAPGVADSDKAVRILAAAKELVFMRGFKGVTIAEIAERAHIGKGTVYLYWKTKQELFHGLLARDFLAMLDGYVRALTADPDLARPHRLFPRLATTGLEHPFVRALHTRDADLLGVLAEHPRSRDLIGTLGPGALMYMVLPVWRRHDLARTDWPLDQQAYALQALLLGFVDAQLSPDLPYDCTVPDPQQVMAAAVTTLLGPERGGPDQVRATAEEGLRLLREARESVLASLR
ncbi:AcrR family transcriptional regulator [Nocardia transvalensis]|uniref:AcrR family transcriptional regulator n=1 Tax=Nocardia transvalensis TaxID=37333 RepID=A0A7W9PCD5_9NOCA|nr:TetR/AcrR family transcriptional regulator [Nocardia transvalensis]MBB5913123.1 AcrR family transcriptional regulator [Nocardia transvalensis]